MKTHIDIMTGKPIDTMYLEKGLPPFLEESLSKWKEVLPTLDTDKCPTDWDCSFCELQSCINVAEVEQVITTEQAWYLRQKYLGISKEDN